VGTMDFGQRRRDACRAARAFAITQGTSRGASRLGRVG
jgi:hypothetical protein